ncbi:extracellular solute-binding protein [Paenibacillus sp. YN15]|uniref:extracellular solute-binding protein n=1 Tax=Paenibacillus sp. YN15 TaxID=1742774 RepID=UPI000DCB5A23|nr:extracellular solute-binding protein [Paenibacillus sp. YN15]RAU97319.1 ABC transporter substrate-binding protein [Paenibacillus sp. YN15]
MKKWIATTLTVLMAAGPLAACAADEQAGKDTAASPAASSGATAGTGAEAAANVYPLKTDKTLTYWGELTGNITGVKASHSEVPFFQEWQKKTGVPLKFIAPPAGQTKEAFNMLLASGDLPDMLEYNFLSFPGGPEKAIKDGYIVKLNDLIDKHAPNLKKFLKENPEIDKMVKTDNGSYYCFPFIRGDEYLRVFQGPIIRQDWLDDLGLPVPTTIDEWTTTLTAFKEKKGAAAPLSFNSKPRFFNDSGSGSFVGAFGILRGYYLGNDGKIKYGPAEPGYKDYLALMHQWYKDGLIDKNAATADSKALDSNMASGAAGATVGNAGGGIGKWQPLIEAKDPKAKLVAAPYPVLKKGDYPEFGQKQKAFSSEGTVAITTAAKDPVLATKLLDYGYSEEGRLFFNFGTEGVSYNMENGYPKYTDLLMKNPDKLAPAQAISIYARGSYNGPFIQDKRYAEQFFALQTQRDAVEVWQKTNGDKHNLPALTPTPEESTEYATIMNDIDTLVDEMTLKIVLGSAPLEEYSKYVDKMKSLKLDRAIAIQQAAYDRYNNR